MVKPLIDWPVKGILKYQGTGIPPIEWPGRGTLEYRGIDDSEHIWSCRKETRNLTVVFQLKSSMLWDDDAWLASISLDRSTSGLKGLRETLASSSGDDHLEAIDRCEEVLAMLTRATSELAHDIIVNKELEILISGGREITPLVKLVPSNYHGRLPGEKLIQIDKPVSLGTLRDILRRAEKLAEPTKEVAIPPHIQNPGIIAALNSPATQAVLSRLDRASCK